MATVGSSQSASALDADVIVVGLGGMGSATLWQLAAAGVRAIGIDQFGAGHDRGASHGQSRIIRTAYAEGSQYVPLLRRAWQLWAELEQASGESLLTRTGGLWLGPAGGDWLAGPVASARAHQLPYQVLTADDVSRRFPAHVVEPGYQGFYEADAGAVRPEEAIRAAVKQARRLGAQVSDRAAVTEVIADPDRPTVRLGGGRQLSARRVVVAAGGWLGQLVPAVRPLLRVVRRVQLWYPARDPDQFAPARFPVFIRTPDPETAWYGVPTLDGQTVKVALHTGAGLDEPVDPNAGPRAPDAVDEARLHELIVAGLPGLKPDPVMARACMYDLSPDEHFLIGTHPAAPGLVLLGGFSGHGFKFAPVVGEIAAELATTGRSHLPISSFAPTRFG